jgi:hypothetical protein
MQIRMIQGVTRTLGEAQGYFGLPVRDERISDVAAGIMTPAMVSAWEPTPAELQRLNGGASVYLRVLGIGHPPVMMFVGEGVDAPVPPVGEEPPALTLARQYLAAAGVEVTSDQLAGAFRLMVAAGR